MNPEPSPPMAEFPPSLLRAADHLKAKFQELPWFIGVHPAIVGGRICLMLLLKERLLPRGMVLPTSFETFKVIIDKTGSVKPGSTPKSNAPSPLW